MIESKVLMQKLGKKGFVDFVVNNRDKEKTGAEMDRGIKGMIRHRRCEHGVWVVEDYEPKHCEKCAPDDSNSVPCPVIHVDSHEYFNVGTGTFGTNKEHRRYAKSIGLEEAG